MPDQQNHINWADRLEEYASGRMSREDMRQMELAAHQDPFLMDAMEGYRLLQATGTLQKGLASLEKSAEPTAAPAPAPIRKLGIPLWRWAAAAAVLVFIGFGVANWVKKDHADFTTEVVDIQEERPEPDLPDLVIGPADKPTEASPAAPDVKPKASKGGKTAKDAGELQLVDELTLKPGELPANPAAPLAENGQPPAAARAAAAPMAQLAGKVVDETNDEPVEAAIILFGGQEIKADALGRFTLMGSTLPAEIRVQASGYKPKMVSWQAGTSALRIALQPAVATVQEQVVQSRGVSSTYANLVVIPNDTSSTSPVGGWAAYNAYFLANKKAKASSKLYKSVTLSFSVDAKGRPYEIEVTQSAGDEARAEALRLLQNGPAWRSRRGATPAATITVKY